MKKYILIFLLLTGAAHAQMMPFGFWKSPDLYPADGSVIPDVTPDPVDFVFNNPTSFLEFSTQQITGINQSISLLFDGAYGGMHRIRYAIDNVEPNYTTKQDWNNNLSSFPQDYVLTVSNNQYITIGVSFGSDSYNFSVSVINLSDSNSILDTFYINYIFW